MGDEGFDFIFFIWSLILSFDFCIWYKSWDVEFGCVWDTQSMIEQMFLGGRWEIEGAVGCDEEIEFYSNGDIFLEKARLL